MLYRVVTKNLARFWTAEARFLGFEGRSRSNNSEVFGLILPKSVASGQTYVARAIADPLLHAADLLPCPPRARGEATRRRPGRRSGTHRLGLRTRFRQ